MLTILNVKFAKNEAEFINSLAKSEGTCFGYYKKLKNAIILKTSEKIDFGFINCFAVIGSRVKLVSGGFWHTYKTPECFEGATLNELNYASLMALNECNINLKK